MMEEIFKKICESEGLILREVADSQNVTKEGFLGNVSKIVLKGINEHKGEEKLLKIVVKTAMKNDVVRKSAFLRELFRREVFMYTAIFPIMTTFQREQNVPISHFAPTYFDHSLAERNETLILKDLNDDGFELYDKKIPMDKVHVKFVMEQYGKFHAVSVAIRDRNPKLFESLKNDLDNVYVKNLRGVKLDEVINVLCNEALKDFNLEEDLDYQKVFAKFCKSAGENYIEFVQEDVEETVILHGDCWSNNMLFKYQSPKSKIPIDMRFIDFQFARLGHPVLDLSFYFFCSADREVLNNSENYLQFYYKSLTSTLKLLQGANPTVFSYETLQRNWKKYAPFGLAVSSVIFYIALADFDDLMDLNDLSEETIGAGSVTLNFGNKEEFFKRMKLNVRYCVDNKYI